MAKIEGWEPHPTRKIIYKDLKTGLLYRRRESGSFDMVPLKMTEHQVLEIFRKADGGCGNNFSVQRESTPPSDKTLAEESD